MDRHPLNSHFSGTADEFSNLYIDAGVIDKVIDLLNLEPDKIAREWKISEERIIKITVKEQLHNDIATMISFFSKPSQTQTETTHTDVTRELASYQVIIEKVTFLLGSMQYENLYNLESEGRKHKAADRIRRASKSVYSNTTAFASGFAKQSYELNGEWPELYNFDAALNTVLPTLKKISEWIEQAEARRLGGKNKDSNKNLLYGFCKIYKDYSGSFNVPNEQILGRSKGSETTYTHEKVLQFLEILLPHTYYGGTRNRGALCQAIRRLKTEKRYQDLFT